MTSRVLTRADAQARRSTARRYLMCPPTFFDVRYAINPWMKPGLPVDRPRALAQWSALVSSYRAHGHRVELLEPVEGLPDLVFTANGATTLDGHVLQARFANPQRAAEAEVHGRWHREHALRPDGTGGASVTSPAAVNEAEGDFAVLAHRVLAGHGFRTTLAAHAELAALTGREVVSLELVDPYFYHLDVALAVLDDRHDHIAYYPPAFSEPSRRLLARLFPDAVRATDADAACLGLNCVSDGSTVWVPAGAVHHLEALAEQGYDPVEIDLSELRRGGGSVKCCTQELRPPAPTHGRRPLGHAPHERPPQEGHTPC
jgi:N-dimethylarginine dimethylaminohydrolase